MSHEMYNNNLRSSEFKKSDSLEAILKEINGFIRNDSSLIDYVPKLPILMVMGCARSGSTLMMQYLANSGLFSYPSNLISRFYASPHIGIRIQQILMDHDIVNDFALKSDNADIYKSNLGKTSGALSPSEFWYFWRQYFSFEDINYLTDEKLKTINGEEFLSKLSAFENLTGKPLVLKGMMLNWNIPFLYSLYSKIIFISLKRDVESNAISLLRSRKKYFGDVTKWYSFKPIEFNNLKHLSPEEQVVKQVLYTQQAVEMGLKQVPSSNKISIDYERFCKDPSQLIQQIIDRFKILGVQFDEIKSDSSSFDVSVCKDGLDKMELENIKRAVRKYT